MSEVKLEKNKQKKVKVLSKIISIIAKIGKILVTIAIPLLILTMLIIPGIINKVNVENGEIVVSEGNKKLAITEEKDGNDTVIIVKLDNQQLAKEKNAGSISSIRNVLESNSKTALIIYFEVAMAIIVINVLLYRKILHNAEEFFANINKKDSPFVDENVNYIKQTAWLMIFATILPIITGIIFKFALKLNSGINIRINSIIEILALFVLGYIFEYGYKLQLDSKSQMYGNAEEDK